MCWTSFTFNGKVFDLSHLNQANIRYEYPPVKSRAPEAFDVEVRYTCHCFTRSQKDKEIVVPAHIFCHDPEARLFDPVRYELSKHLPTVIANLKDRIITANGNKREKYFCVELETDNGQIIEYEVYIKLRKVNKGKLDLLVETAFVREPENKSKRPKGISVRFRIALYKTLRGEKLRL
jgi:hypothetical protein